MSRPVVVVYDSEYPALGESLYESFTFPIDGVWNPMEVDPWAFDVPDRCFSNGYLCKLLTLFSYPFPSVQYVCFAAVLLFGTLADEHGKAQQAK